MPQLGAFELGYGELGAAYPSSSATNKNTTDSLAIALTESASVTVPQSVTDAIAVALSEAGQFQYAASDSISLGLSEAVAILARLSASDSLTLALSEATSFLETASDSLGIGLSDSASFYVLQIASDSLALAVLETFGIAGRVGANVFDFDALAFQLVESCAVSVLAHGNRARNFITAEALSTAIQEQSALTGTSPTLGDSYAFGLLESATVSKLGSILPFLASDVAAFALTESAQVLNNVTARNTTTDALALDIAETASVVLGSLPPLTWITADRLALQAIDTFTLTQPIIKHHRVLIVSDVLRVSITAETATQSIPAPPIKNQSAQDTLGISFLERPAIKIIASGPLSLSAGDSLAIALTEAAGATVLQPLSLNLTVGEPLTLAIAETAFVQTLLVDLNIAAEDSLALQLAEIAAVSALFQQPHPTTGDSLALALTETALLIAPGNHFTAAEHLALQFGEQASVRVDLGGGVFAIHVNDSLNVALSESWTKNFNANVKTVSPREILAVALTETATAVVFSGGAFPVAAADAPALNVLEGFILSTPTGKIIGIPELLGIALTESASVGLGSGVNGGECRITQSVVEVIQSIQPPVRNTQTVIEIIMIPVPPKSYTDESVPPDIGTYCY